MGSAKLQIQKVSIEIFTRFHQFKTTRGSCKASCRFLKSKTHKQHRTLIITKLWNSACQSLDVPLKHKWNAWKFLLGVKNGHLCPPPIAAISLWRQWIHWITMNNRSEWWWTQISGSSVPKTGAKANNPSMKTAYEWGQLHLQFAKRLLWIGNPSHKHPTHQHSSHITGDAQSQTSTGFISTHQTNHIDCQHQKTSMTL